MNEIIHCIECKHRYICVCTFYKFMPMISRKGYCYHAVRGEYKGEPISVIHWMRKRWECIKRHTYAELQRKD